MVWLPPIAGRGPRPDAESTGPRHGWLTAERLARLRGILLGLTLFFGLAVYVFHTLGAAHIAQPELVKKLRGVGRAHLDLRARPDGRHALLQQPLGAAPPRRHRHSRQPHGWLFGQMLAWFGILYYGLTEDARAGMLPDS